MKKNWSKIVDDNPNKIQSTLVLTECNLIYALSNLGGISGILYISFSLLQVAEIICNCKSGEILNEYPNRPKNDFPNKIIKIIPEFDESMNAENGGNDMAWRLFNKNGEFYSNGTNN